MKKMVCALIISLGFSTLLHSQSAIRYIDSTFTEAQTYTNQVYASAPQLTVPYLKDTSLIEAADPHIPVLLIHGTADTIVPFGLGSPFQVPPLSATYGSQLIDKRLAGLAYPHETYFVQGEGHEFYGVVNGNWSPAPNQYWYIIVDKVRDFLFDIHKPIVSFNQTINGAQVTFTNNSTNAIAWHWNFGDYGTRELLEANLADEENHIDWIDAQLDQIKLSKWESKTT